MIRYFHCFLCVYLITIIITIEGARQQQTQTHTGCYNERPIIGVLTQQCRGKRAVYGDQYFAASYVKWLESAGARVVPVKINQTEKYYNHLFESLNGILFPGGGQNLLTSGYANAARYFFRKSMAEANKSGDYFPIWGTCLGLEELLVLAVEERRLDRIAGTKGVTLPTNFMPGVESRLLSSPHGLSDRTKATLTTENSTSHFHKYGLMKSSFESMDGVKNIFKIVATAFDGNGDEFVDIVEGNEYPFYGVQFHPEKNAYEWKRRIASGLPHSVSSIRASQDFAHFFVDETRRNCHRFASGVDENVALIYNWSPQETSVAIDSVFQQQYFFNVTDPASSLGFVQNLQRNVVPRKRNGTSCLGRMACGDDVRLEMEISQLEHNGARRANATMAWIDPFILTIAAIHWNLLNQLLNTPIGTSAFETKPL